MKIKILIFLIISLIPVVSLCQSHHKLTHYNINNSNLTPYHLSVDKFLLVGWYGGVLRTTNSGENWEQTYSGTHNSILKVIQHGSDIFGITIQGDFMKSEDGGDKWDVKKVSDSILFDFYIKDNLFYINQLKDSIMISSDIGNSWTSEFVVKDTIQNIYVQSSKIIVKTFRNGLLIKDNGVWDKFPLPEEIPSEVNYRVINKKSGFYLIGNYHISKLNNNFNWDSYKISDFMVNDIIETDKQFITFKSKQNWERIDVVYYDKPNMTISKAEMITDTNLSLHHFNVIGTSINEKGDIIVTAPGKTIFIKKQDSDWETKSAFIVPGIETYYYSKFFTKDEWRFTSSFGNYMWTNDGGTTFGKGTRAIETLKTNNVQYITKDSINFAVENEEFNFASSSDAGKTFNFKNLDSPYTSYNLYSLFKNSKIYNFEGFKNMSQKHPFTIFFKEENGLLDTLFELDSFFVDCSLIYKDKILIIENQNENFEFCFLLTDSELKNPNKVYSLKLEYDKSNSDKPRIKYVFINQKGELFIVFERWPDGIQYTYTSIYKITDFYSEPELVFEEEPIYFYYPSNYRIDESEKIVTIGKLNKDTTGLDFYYGNLDFSNGFNYEIIGENDVPFMSPEYTLDDGTLLFQRASNNLWRPIEEDRLITNVETEPIPPAIWTYPPYPNPTTNSVRIAFYSGVMQDISQLKVKIINISSGISKSVIPSNVIIESNWHGIIDLDLSDFLAGSYLIEFNLSNKKSVEKLIITK